MGIGESAQVWEQMDMDAVTGDFERLFPSFSFDAQGVLADIMSGQLLEALKKLGDGLSGAVVFQREEFRTLFLRFWFWVWRRRFLPILRTCSKTIRYRSWLSISYTFL